MKVTSATPRNTIFAGSAACLCRNGAPTIETRLDDMLGQLVEPEALGASNPFINADVTNALAEPSLAGRACVIGAGDAVANGALLARLAGISYIHTGESFLVEGLSKERRPSCR